MLKVGTKAWGFICSQEILADPSHQKPQIFNVEATMDLGDHQIPLKAKLKGLGL